MQVLIVTMRIKMVRKWYLGNFWRALNIPLISCEVSLELKWNKNCVITSLKERKVDAGPPPVLDGAPTGASLAINDCKL